MDRTPPDEFGDDGNHDDLAALDFSVGEHDEEGSILGAFDDYVQAPDAVDDIDDFFAIEPNSAAAEELSGPLFTVTNPPGTVSVTTHLDGRVHQIELTTRAAAMSEPQLADEVLVIADLARQRALSAQYELMLDGMHDAGHDSASTRDFLARDLQLPSPDEAAAAAAPIFTKRYVGEHD